MIPITDHTQVRQGGEAIRTWTLNFSRYFGVDLADGPMLRGQEEPEVVELEPVLDLLEETLRWVPPKPTDWPKDSVSATYEEIQALLREHGRLP